MNYQYYMGIDMAKLSFDFAILHPDGSIIKQGKVQNSLGHTVLWINSLNEKFQIPWSKTLICMEHAGYYNLHLLQALHQNVDTNIWVESPLQIKRSGGVQRGKDDAIDALRIAAYALDFQRKARLWEPQSQSLQRLALLVSHRDRMVKNLMSIKNALNEEKDFIQTDFFTEMAEISNPAILAMQKAITNFDLQISSLLKTDSQLQKQSQIIQSIPGFGQVIASKLIIATQGFTRLQNPRAFACFAGVAPFPYRSGTSIRGKNRISHFAHKEIKKMLHLAALVTIRKGNIMQPYFHRKVAQGKNKMAIINAIRNKLIHILMACIRNNTRYDKNYHSFLA